MFTGIVTGIGEVIGRNGGNFTIRCPYPAETLEIGGSMACNGCCLTVTSIRTDDGAVAGSSIFTADVSNETCAKTTIDSWQPGTRINLERPLAMGQELGGHLVTGHVDGVARIADIIADGDSRRFVIEAPDHLAPYIAPKGSVALDGVSLTVNEVSDNCFGVNIIPHTLTVTTWGAKTAGQSINLEVDLFSRYIARLLEFRT
ncbi:riboflavin synthase [Hyphomicrobium sp. D-2]|uniref:riboflavin synthase n=1 Tax=Hyphomicrobium sp. D-2 TaxID=3041621 RepID=UPI0024543F57|nr:riboflavin synthase [Hyphomicrobium sp. D-2]MDH4981223.1 riboflavin synthase [Hyphomicrobium sp. D-2]MDH4982118.1 riboflavin synthase [Hyphomicrobium sp. D-2]